MKSFISLFLIVCCLMVAAATATAQERSGKFYKSFHYVCDEADCAADIEVKMPPTGAKIVLRPFQLVVIMEYDGHEYTLQYFYDHQHQINEGLITLHNDKDETVGIVNYQGKEIVSARIFDTPSTLMGKYAYVRYMNYDE